MKTRASYKENSRIRKTKLKKNSFFIYKKKRYFFFFFLKNSLKIFYDFIILQNIHILVYIYKHILAY